MESKYKQLIEQHLTQENVDHIANMILVSNGTPSHLNNGVFGRKAAIINLDNHPILIDFIKDSNLKLTNNLLTRKDDTQNLTIVDYDNEGNLIENHDLRGQACGIPHDAIEYFKQPGRQLFYGYNYSIGVRIEGCVQNIFGFIYKDDSYISWIKNIADNWSIILEPYGFNVFAQITYYYNA